MTLHVSESGVTLRIFTGIDLTAATQIQLLFSAPDRTVVTKSLTAGDLVVGDVDVEDSVIGEMPAGEYVEYELEGDVLNQPGVWKGQLVYTNANETPTDKYAGDVFRFTVAPNAGVI